MLYIRPFHEATGKSLVERLGRRHNTSAMALSQGCLSGHGNNHKQDLTLTWP